MGRRAHISDADLLAAAGRGWQPGNGPSQATVAAIAKEAKVPIGSVYHRVPSRSALMADVWIVAAERFGTEFLSLLERVAELEAAAEIALLTPRFTRADHAGGVVLLAHRRDDFLDGAPEEKRTQASRLSSDLQKGLGGGRAAAASARQARPRAPGRRADRRSLWRRTRVPPQATPPAELDPVIVAAARAALTA